MRVLHTTWSAGFGGIERLILDLSKAEKELGLAVTILFGQFEGEFVELFRASQLEVEVADLSSGWDISPRKFEKVTQLMRTYDVVHIHAYNPVFARCAARSGAKVIYTDHGTCAKGQKLTIRRRAKRVLQKRFLRKHVDFITFNSVFTQESAKRHLGIQQVPHSVVYNGIDFRSRATEDGNLPTELNRRLANQFVVGTTSRFVEFKRVDRLIRAFSQFQTDKSTVLLLVGDGPLEHEYVRLVEELEITQKTVFAGFRRNVKAFQEAIDVCVFPSQREPFGLVAVETLTLGKPTICMFDGGGLTEIVGSLESHDVVGSEDELSCRLEWYYQHRKQLAENQEERAQHGRKFDIAVMAQELKDIYYSVLEHDNRASSVSSLPTTHRC